MTAWWDSLIFIEQIFVCIAVPATLIMLIQTIMLLVGAAGGDSDFDTDADTDLDMDFDTDFDGGGIPDVYNDYSPADLADAGLRVFTVRGFIAFFTVFGWGALAVSRSGAAAGMSIFVGTVLGFCMMLIIGFILRFAAKLQSNGVIEITNALGVSGNAYLPIPPGREYPGKVSVLVQGRLTEYGAVTDEESTIPTGAEVVVVGVSGRNTLVVRRK